MNPTTSGETVSADDKLKEIDRILDEYESGIGLKQQSFINEAEALKYINLSHFEFRAMSALDCVEAAYVLEQFAFFIQRGINREQARVRWAEDNLRVVLVPTLKELPERMWYEEKKATAIRGNVAAMKLEKLRINAQLRIDRLTYLSLKLESMSKVLIEMQRTKREKANG